mmetsp:Transcript_27402/g.94818  ORF Transcript_27402/g.94818 Transcript_27402/m.94818 type:complete len:544 (-) Transcript_27402:38-1669(-)
MASIGDAFLADLDDLGGSSSEEEVEGNAGGGGGVGGGDGGGSGAGAGAGGGASASGSAGEGAGVFAMPAPRPTGAVGGAGGPVSVAGALAAAASARNGAGGAASRRNATLAGGGLATVAKLRHSERFRKHMALLAALDERERSSGEQMSADELQDVVVESNRLVADLGDEIVATQKYAAELFGAKFPELERIVTNPLDYIRVVKRIGNRTELSGVSLDDLLPPAQVMSVSMTSATAKLPVLPDDELRECHAACDEVLALTEAKADVLRFLEKRMAAIAPNVSAILGASITAQLVGLAGGLVELAKIPACNLQVLGQEKKKNLAGFSTAAATPHAGLVYFSDLVQSAPAAMRNKACRVTSAKVALAVRLDRIGQATDGSAGERWRDEIAEKIEKWQEPPPGKKKRPLPIPDEGPKKRRGGKRFRRERERLAMTDMRKDANRLAFGQEDGEYGDSGMGRTLGVLGTSASGRLRVTKKETKKAATRMKAVGGLGGSSGATSGFASSLAFTPVAGLELPDLAAQRRKLEEANSKFFGASSTFKGAKK